MMDTYSDYVDSGQYLQEGSNISPFEFQRRLEALKYQLSQNQIQVTAQGYVQKADTSARYAAQLAQQAQIRANNLQTTTNIQVQNLLDMQDFNNSMTTQNNAILANNASAIVHAADFNQQQANAIASNRAGTVRQGYAGAGVIADTGSASDATNQTLTETFRESDNNFAGQIGKATEMLNQIYQNTATNQMQRSTTQNRISLLNANVQDAIDAANVQSGYAGQYGYGGY